jgi:hypothetical protein
MMLMKSPCYLGIPPFLRFVCCPCRQKGKLPIRSSQKFLFLLK